MPENEAMRQLRRSGYAVFLQHVYCDEACVRGTIKPELLGVLERRLREDCDHGTCGGLHGLHKDVGRNRFEWRSHRGTYGDGSLQIVIGRDTGRVYADIDRFSPYDDLVGFAGHSGEVIGPKLKALGKTLSAPFRKLRTLVRWLRTPESEREG
jgi:hypothetical protein